MERVLNVLNYLDTLEPDMALGTLRAFLAVAKAESEADKHWEGMPLSEVQSATNLTTSAASRSLAALGDVHWDRRSGKEALNWVSVAPSLEDRRVKVVKLTTKGRSVYNTMKGMIHGSKTAR